RGGVLATDVEGRLPSTSAGGAPSLLLLGPDMTASASPPTDPETRPSSAPPSARTSTRSTTRAAAARTRRFELPLPFIYVVGLVGAALSRCNGRVMSCLVVERWRHVVC